MAEILKDAKFSALSVEGNTQVGNLTVNGNFTVEGATTNINTTNTTITDKLIELQSGITNNEDATDSGILIQRGNAVNAFMGWNETSESFVFGTTTDEANTAGNLNITAAPISINTITASGIIKTDDTTEATSTEDGSLQTDGGLSVVKSAVIGDDLDLLSDGAILNIGSTSKFTLTDQSSDNTVMATANHRLAFGNPGEYISGDENDLKIISSGDVDITASTVDITGNLEISGSLTLDSTTISTAEIGVLDNAVAGTIVNNKAVIYGDAGEINAAKLQVSGSDILASVNELNLLQGVNATTDELNILSGMTATTDELNLLDDAVAGTIVNSKAVIYGATGEVNATTLQTDNITTSNNSINFSGKKITNVDDPTNNNDVATKAYVDSVASGLDVKKSVRVATIANITIATDLNNQDVLDGVTLENGDRVLVKDQTTASENGIYIVGDSPGRASDFDEDSEVTSGAFTFVEEGNTYNNQGFVLTTDVDITVGTTDLAFSQFSGAGVITAGTGLLQTGNTLDVKTDQSHITAVGTLDGGSITSNFGDIDIGTSEITTSKLNINQGGKISHTSTVLNNDFTIEQLGNLDSSLLIKSEGTGDDAIGISASAGGIDVEALNYINISSTLGQPNAIHINSQGRVNPSNPGETNGGIQLDGGGPISITSTKNSINAISLTANASFVPTDGSPNHMGGISLSATNTIDITSTKNSPAPPSINILAKGSNDPSNPSSIQRILIENEEGTDPQAIKLLADAGGISLEAPAGGINVYAHSSKNTTITSGKVELFSTNNSQDAINLRTNSGNSETISLTNSQGESINAIELNAVSGGIKMNAANRITVSSTQNAVKAIHIHAMGSYSSPSFSARPNQKILIENDDGTSLDAIKLNAIAGGLKMDAAKRIDITSTENTAKAIYLHAQGNSLTPRTNQKILIENDDGTGVDAIGLITGSGGIKINASSGKDVDIIGGQVKLTSTDNITNTINLETNAGNNETITIKNNQGVRNDAIALNAISGGITINSSTGFVFILNLPTTNPGVSGALYNDSGTLKIS